MPGGLGYFKVDRGIRDWKYWGNAAVRGFWLYLIEEANWKDGWYGKGISVPRGSFITSFEKMARENELSKNTIRKYVGYLENEGQIKVSASNKYTMITVVKYDEYQGVDDAGSSKYDLQNELQGEHQGEPQGEHQREHNRRKKRKKESKKGKISARETSSLGASSSSSESLEDSERRAALLKSLKGEI